MEVMKKFEASSASVKVNGETILSFVKAVPASEDSRREILKKHGINDPKPGQWYSQQAWLNAFKEISEKIGPVTLRLIGKAIPKNAKFPPQIKETKEAFEMLDKAYKMNYKGGFIVEYKFLSFDPQKKEIKMEINTPYPEDFDAGIMLGLFEKFKPADVIRQPNVRMEKKVNGIVYTLTW
jgi:hypothetical protein